MCARTARAGHGGTPLGWAWTVERGRISYLCDRCSRENIRSIEAKLPEQYWE